MRPPGHPILTIGHSNLPMERFLEVLKNNQVFEVADIRSSPYSRRFPHFNREPLRLVLDSVGIEYAFFGKELGGRSSNKECYANGRVQYSRLAGTDEFRSGLKRLLNNSGKGITVLLCAEREPLDCHRSLLVARELLKAKDVDVAHIQTDGSVEPHLDAEMRLMDLWGIKPDQGVLFLTGPGPLDEAYARQEARVAFASPDFAQTEERVTS